VDSQKSCLRTLAVPQEVPLRGGAVMPSWSIWGRRD
jgi:hypothetical protein